MNISRKPLPRKFLLKLKELEEAYLAETDPTRQSGFLGGETRWRVERGIILEAVDGIGDFLDIGCANGYLLQCLVEWAKERGIILTPHGIDQGKGLIALARRKLPQFAANFTVANAWDWKPQRRFRYVYTMTDVVPETYLKEYILRVKELFVDKGGTLIVGGYGSYSKNLPAQDVTALLVDMGLNVAGSAVCGGLPITHIAWLKN